YGLGRKWSDLLERWASGGIVRPVPLPQWRLGPVRFLAVCRWSERNKLLAWTKPVARQTNDLVFARLVRAPLAVHLVFASIVNAVRAGHVVFARRARALLVAPIAPFAFASFGFHRFADLSPQPMP